MKRAIIGVALLISGAALAQNPWDIAKKAAGQTATVGVEKEVNSRLLEEGHVPGVEDVEAAVGEHDGPPRRLPAGALLQQVLAVGRHRLPRIPRAQEASGSESSCRSSSGRGAGAVSDTPPANSHRCGGR